MQLEISDKIINSIIYSQIVSKDFKLHMEEIKIY